MENDFVRSTERNFRDLFEVAFTSDELKLLAAPSSAGTAKTLTIIWLEIFVLVGAANAAGIGSNPLHLAITLTIAFLIGTRINALGVVMHEGSHGFLSRNRLINDRICNLGAAWWLGHSVEEYRPAHRLHHRYLGGERDPDRISSQIPPNRGALTLLLIQDLFGISAFRKALVIWSASKDSQVESGGWLGITGKATAQCLVIVQFSLLQGSLTQGVLLYLAYWLFPVLCVFALIQRVKTLVEHYSPELWDPNTPLWVARSSNSGAIQNHVLGAQMEYHFEHHVVPTIPFAGLKKIHTRLVSEGTLDRLNTGERERSHSGGYLQFMVGSFRSLRATAIKTN